MTAHVLDKRRVAARFGRHAGTYEANALVQDEMADRLVAALARLALAPSSILELGCGTGRLTERLAVAYPSARLLAVDIARPMVEAARARLAGRPRVEVRLADAEALESAERFDLVVSNATIQWFAAPAASLRRLAGLLAPGGAMAHATLGPATFVELLAALGTPRERGGHGGPSLVLHPARRWAAWLVEAGLADVEARRRLVRRDYESARAFLAALRATGAAYAHEPRRAGRRLGEAMRRYDAAYRSPAGTYATFEVIELYARAAGGC
ncbi:MAG TPA: methyltransferase domain-containing protein [Acidimicrobiales bacterium]|nr:methyltransferase domain-containing protein [Acidimicrobiales bacterium]